MDDHSTIPTQSESSAGPFQSQGVRHKIGPTLRLFKGPLTLEMPSEISRILNELMNQTNHDPEELFYRGLLLDKAAVDAHEAGKRMVILDPENRIEQEITGL